MGRGRFRREPKRRPATRFAARNPLPACLALLLAALLVSTPVIAQEPATPDVPEPPPVEETEASSPEPPGDESDGTLSEPIDAAPPGPPVDAGENGSPTEPAATVAYRLDDRPTCKPLPEQSTAVPSGGTIDYACVSAVTLFGERIVPAGVTLVWTVEAEIGDGWVLALLSPGRDSAIPEAWIASINGLAGFSADHPGPAGTTLEAASFETRIELAYRLRLHRPACALSAPAARISHTVAIASPDAAPVDLAAAAPEPLRLEPALAALPDPEVVFAGPLNFGQIGATAAGLLETRRSGALDLVISGLDRTCGEWTLLLAATPIVDAAGEPREGFRLLLTAVNGDPLAGDGCDLAANCIALILTSGPDAPAALTVTLTITLQAPQQASLGAFSTTLDATMLAAAGAESEP